MEAVYEIENSSCLITFKLPPPCYNQHSYVMFKIVFIVDERMASAMYSAQRSCIYLVLPYFRMYYTKEIRLELALLWDKRWPQATSHGRDPKNGILIVLYSTNYCVPCDPYKNKRTNYSVPISIVALVFMYALYGTQVSDSPHLAAILRIMTDLLIRFYGCSSLSLSTSRVPLRVQISDAKGL
ncbi:hypothetical protein VNO77_00688 [Canavalia gladiata]|uniref:Uncharacterized protein n=1 Tax=Canavalia gladiata TaxID=3824 RepID=A0AAN9MPV8_CANGL